MGLLGFWEGYLSRYLSAEVFVVQLELGLWMNLACLVTGNGLFSMKD